MGREGSVLVTGGAGYIGSHAVIALLDAGHQVVVIDNLSTGFASAVDARATFRRGDIRDADLVAGLLAEHDVRAIMHFAGSIIVPESVADPLKYYDNNTAASRGLIQAAVQGGVRRFIFSSTAAVYGTPDGDTVTEVTPTRPINPYGSSKLMTEIMLRDTAAATGLAYAALRYFNVAGADPQGRTGQATAGATHLIKVASEVALGKRDHIDVFGTDFPTPDGTGVRDYIHVTDLADAHLLALERLEAAPGDNLVLNCGIGRGFSVLEVIDAVERVAGCRIERRMAPRRAGDPAMLVASNEAITRTLGWAPRFAELDTIVRHALAWEGRLPRA